MRAVLAPWTLPAAVLRLAMLAFAIVAAPALAQEWPSGTVRVIVPYAAGGPLDLPARLLIDRLAAQTKGTFILEHRAGAGGAVGAQAVVQSPARRQHVPVHVLVAGGGARALSRSSASIRCTALVPISLITEFPISVAVRANSSAARSRRPDRQGEGAAGQAHLRLGRRRHRQSSRRRAAQAHGRHRSPARAVPRHLARDHRALLRRHRHGGDRTRSNRWRMRATDALRVLGGRRGDAHAGAARRADDRRGWCPAMS